MEDAAHNTQPTQRSRNTSQESYDVRETNHRTNGEYSTHGGPRGAIAQRKRVRRSRVASAFKRANVPELDRTDNEKNSPPGVVKPAHSAARNMKTNCGTSQMMSLIWSHSLGPWNARNTFRYMHINPRKKGECDALWHEHARKKPLSKRRLHAVQVQLLSRN